VSRRLFGRIEGAYILVGGRSDPRFFRIVVGFNPYSPCFAAPLSPLEVALFIDKNPVFKMITTPVILLTRTFCNLLSRISSSIREPNQKRNFLRVQVP
jgi:hypothetical protein